MKKQTLFICPVYLKAKDEGIEEAIRRMASLGRVLVISQGEKIGLDSKKVEIIHLSEPLGVWGANQVAFQQIKENPDKYRDIGQVLLNMSPKNYNRGECFTGLLKPILKQESEHAVGVRSETVHAVGVRRNIAATLHSEKRALLECFFSTLAGLAVGHSGAISHDGFTGIQAMTFERYLASDWTWIEAQKGKQPWGGALITQLQSCERGLKIAEVPLDIDAPRNWQTTLGKNEGEAVLNMLDKCRRLPIFQAVPAEKIEEALERFPEDFADQPFIDGQARARVERILGDYEKSRGEAVFK